MENFIFIFSILFFITLNREKIFLKVAQSHPKSIQKVDKPMIHAMKGNESHIRELI